LRAPQDHGKSLQLPPLSDGPRLVDANQKVLSNYPSELTAIRHIARRELPRIAFHYSRQYSDVAEPSHLDSLDSIVMAGHQPTLFHPGVWFKNFALGSLSQSCRATAINLVVDNDLCGDTSMSCPQIDSGGNVRLLRVPFDAANVAVPYEMRSIADRKTVASFGQRLASSIRDVVEAPLIDRLWPEVVSATERLSLPASIAAGRHRIEQKHGIENLELPVGRMATTESFAMFFERIAVEAPRFVEIYNRAIVDYRRVHRIRSRSHPVPELETDGRLQEVPFWVWTKSAPNRRRLYVCCHAKSIELGDRDGWSVSLDRDRFKDSFQSMNQLDTEVFIRPRALATTMFSRLFASDLFLHGIGGAKYDQLNDEIMRRFFEIEPPEFMTMTATMKLPFDYENVTRRNVTELEVRLRQLRFHPEVHYSDHGAAIRKSELIANPPKSGSRKAWRDEIAVLNETLFDLLPVRRNSLEKKISLAKSSLPDCKILGSREFSFALFPESLIEELRELSTEP
jgi:hypothetical protein